MREILLINPRKKSRKKTTRKKAAKKRVYKKRVVRKKTTPKRTVAKSRTTRRKTTARAKGVSTMAKRKRRKSRRNPSRARRTYRRAASRTKATFSGLNFKGAFKNMLSIQVGMFAAKWGAKRFGPDASETDPDSWDWSSYLKSALGATIAAFLAQNIKRGSGQKVLEGGLSYTVFKMLQNEVIVNSEWATKQFGGADDDYYPDEYLQGEYLDGADYDDEYQPGDVETDETGQPYLLGQDYQWQALPEVAGMGELHPVGPLGEALEPVGPLGDDTDDRYRDALFS